MQATPDNDIGPRRMPPEQAQARDIKRAKMALTRLGYYAPDPSTGMTGEADDGFRDALFAFRRKVESFHDDTDFGPDSITRRLLDEALESQARDEILPRHYTWRTVGDDKVRGDHAARAGRIFPWDEPPEGGHPGEDYNCRCWAEPLNPSYHPWIAWAKERQEQRIARSAAREGLAPSRGLNDGLTDLMTPVPLDGIYPVYPVETVIGIGLGPIGAKITFNIIEGVFRDAQWSFGKHKSSIQWNNRMKKRGWTEKKISETIKKGKKFNAPNDVNKGNRAIRYEYKGNFVVRDEKTKEIIQLGAESFERRIR